MKYKLKQWYPSLPKDWEVGMEVGQGDRHYGHYSPCNGKYKDYCICAEIVENNPEFWEKVVEKDWEIVALISSHGKVSTHYKDGKVKWSTDDDPEFTEIQELLNAPKSEHFIYSVKRLSDGEIFSVGDKLKSGDIISGIEVHNNTIYLSLMGNSCYGGPIFLERLEKTKEPILITEDGKEIFKGDSVIPVNIDNLTIHAVWTLNTGESLKYGNYKHFSTKELAEKYVEENKPMYSKKDMLDFGKTLCFGLEANGYLEHMFKAWKKEKGD